MSTSLVPIGRGNGSRLEYDSQVSGQRRRCSLVDSPRRAAAQTRHERTRKRGNPHEPERRDEPAPPPENSAVSRRNTLGWAVQRATPEMRSSGTSTRR